MTATVLQAYNDIQCIPFEKRTLPVIVEVVFLRDIFPPSILLFNAIGATAATAAFLMFDAYWNLLFYKRQSKYFKINFLFMLGKFNIAEHTINTDISIAAAAAA